MSWLDEYPHKIYASILLLDNKIENWKVGNRIKEVPDFSGFWNTNRLNDYTSQHTEFIVNNKHEHNNAYSVLATEWFKQWEISDSFYGFRPY